MGYPDENSFKRTVSDIATMLRYKFNSKTPQGKEKEDLEKVIKLINDFRKKVTSDYRLCSLLKLGYTYSCVQQLFMIGNPLLQNQFSAFFDDMAFCLSDIKLDIDLCKKMRNHVKSGQKFNADEIESLINLMTQNSKGRFNNTRVIDEAEKTGQKCYSSKEHREQIEEKVALILQR